MKYLALSFLFLFSTAAWADVNWTTYSDQALAQATEDGKKVVLGFHKKGCGTCKALDASLAEAGINDAQNTVFLVVQRKNSSHKPVYERYGFSQRQWAAIVLLDTGGQEIARINPGTTSGPSIKNLVDKAI